MRHCNDTYGHMHVVYTQFTYGKKNQPKLGHTRAHTHISIYII